MAHALQFEYFELLKKIYPDRFKDVRVLEVGSLDINGSIRQCFESCDYVGVDLEEGKGVDLAKEGQLLDFPTRSFDVVASAECLEHNPFWAETVVNMLRMMKEDGMISISCASYGREEHGTSRTTPTASPFTVDAKWEYYRNLGEKDFRFLDLPLPSSRYLDTYGSRSSGCPFLDIPYVVR